MGSDRHVIYVETIFSRCYYLCVLFISKTKDFKIYINIEHVGSVKSTQTSSSPCTSSSFRPLEVLIFACRWQLTFSHSLLDDLHVKAYIYLCFKQAMNLVTQTAFAFLWKTDVFLLLNGSLLYSSCRLDLERWSWVHCWNISIVFTFVLAPTPHRLFQHQQNICNTCPIFFSKFSGIWKDTVTVVTVLSADCSLQAKAEG